MRSYIKCLPIIAAIAILPAAPHAQSRDPYAAGDEKVRLESYNRERDAFLDSVRMLYFAVGCEVFASEGNILPLIQNESVFLSEAETANRIMDTHVAGMMHQAARDGANKAGEPGACRYWHERPEAVATVRRMAESAMR